jgi:flagellar FliL protein
MAEEEKEGTKEEGKGKKSPVLLIVIVVVAVLLIVAIALFAFLVTGSDNEAQGGAPAGQKQSTQREGSARNPDMANIGMMVELDDFTVNLLSEGGKRYLRTKINLELGSNNLQSEIEKKIPVLRDIIIQVLSSKQIEEITTKDGKERLKDELVKALNRALIDGQLKNVYFTTFVIQ